MHRWASHPDAIVAPVDLQAAAVEIDLYLATGQPAACGGNGGSRGQGEKLAWGAAFLVIPKDEDIVVAAAAL